MPSETNPVSPHEGSVSYVPPPETQRLMAELYRQELVAARAMPPEEKVLAGQRLFEAACRVTLAGIHDQFPGASEDQCREILRGRLQYKRKLEATE